MPVRETSTRSPAASSSSVSLPSGSTEFSPTAHRADRTHALDVAAGYEPAQASAVPIDRPAAPRSALDQVRRGLTLIQPAFCTGLDNDTLGWLATTIEDIRYWIGAERQGRATALANNGQ
ncbi:MAG: hypothetical protein H7Z42_10260 [Roseiflexaceae bacterium]|nr:hypothetical protein [Roseiflexaceae bacterium]